MHLKIGKLFAMVLSIAFVFTMSLMMAPFCAHVKALSAVSPQDFTLTYNGGTSYTITMPNALSSVYTWEYYAIPDEKSAREEITSVFYEMNAMLDQTTSPGGDYTYNGIQKTATWIQGKKYQFVTASINIDLGYKIGGFFVGRTVAAPTDPEREPIFTAGGTIDIPTTAGQSVSNVLGKKFKLNAPSGATVTPESTDGTYTPGTKLTITFAQTVNGLAFDNKVSTSPASDFAKDVSADDNKYICTMPFSDLAIQNAYNTPVSLQDFELKNNGDGTYTVTPKGTLGENQYWVVVYVDGSVNKTDDTMLQKLHDMIKTDVVGQYAVGSVPMNALGESLEDSKSDFFMDKSYTMKAADLKFVGIIKAEKSNNETGIVTMGSTITIPELGEYVSDDTLIEGKHVNITSGKTDRSNNKYLNGETVKIVADEAPSGKVFDKWVCSTDGVTLSDASAATATFTMPETDVTIQATYKDIPKPVAKIDVTTNTTGTATPQISITNTTAEIKDIVMTDAEKTNYDNGIDTSVYLDVKDISGTVPAEEKAKIESKLGDNKIAMYIDASLFLKQGDTTRQITQTNGKIKVTIKIPAAYLNTTTGTTRTYEIVRYHDGVAEVIGGTFNADTNEFTFETDKFSTYAIAYKDAAITTTTTTTTSTSSTPVAKTTTASPKTGVPASTIPVMAVLFIMLLAIGVYGVEKKKY